MRQVVVHGAIVGRTGGAQVPFGGAVDNAQSTSRRRSCRVAIAHMSTANTTRNAKW
jgi:hypothetical protein